MRYTTYGRTGLKVSRLGFGAMRLPVNPTPDGKEQVDYDKSTPLIRRALELGVNIIDTHHNYHYSQSEIAIGLATEGLDRSSFIIQTKSPTWKDLAPGETWRARLEEGLVRAKTDYFDIYFMHSLSWPTFEKVGDAFIKEILQAKSEGLVRHVGFSTHDTYENIVKIIDTGLFECMLCQYNLLDLSNEEAICYAHSKGVGVSVMGPVGGGRLATPNELAKFLPGEPSGVEAALRFVWDNANVDIAMSGMSTIEQVEENVRLANIAVPLSDAERRRIAEIREEKKKLADLYCTGCGYCMPCPNGVNISRVFEYMNWMRVYGFGAESAKEHYSWMMGRGKDASKCIECGECEPKCPQKIPIIAQLKESHKALSS
jgi:hypothetical protein